MIGQDAVTTARAFQEGVDFTGVVLTKLDGDARGGAALSVASITGRPIMFASTGEGLDDFEPFHPDRMASRILDLGDILTLIEQAQQSFDEDEAKKTAEKFATDTFTLDDFLKQMQQLKNMGSIKGMLGMLPGARGMKRAARELRRERDHPHRGDHPVDDAAGAAAAEAAERIAPAAHREGLGHDRHRGQPARAAVRAGREDDEDGRQGRGAAGAGHGADPRRGVRRQEEAGRRRRSRSRATRRSARPRTRRCRRRRRLRRRADRASGWARARAGDDGPSEEELAALQKMLGR